MSVGTFIHPELADMCNFKCEFCPPDKRSYKMFDIDKFREVLDVASVTPIFGIWYNRIQLNGNGEPLLYPHIAEAIRIAKERFPWCEFTTNGYLLDEKKAREVLEAGIDEINISLTGIDPQVYRHFQGSGIPYDHCVRQLRTVVRNVRRLARIRDEMGAKTRIQLRYIRSDDSSDHLKDYIAFWKGTGVDEIFVTSLWSFKRPGKGKRKFKVLACSNAPRRYQISANGEVFPCTCNYDDKRNRVGDINQMPFGEIIHSRKFLDEKRRRMSCDLNLVPKSCLSCENRTLRDLGEELRHMRDLYDLKNPARTLLCRMFGPSVVIFERITRYRIFYEIYLAYLRISSKKIHDDFIRSKKEAPDAGTV